VNSPGDKVDLSGWWQLRLDLVGFEGGGNLSSESDAANGLDELSRSQREEEEDL
jgi:hypothetical protein